MLFREYSLSPQCCSTSLVWPLPVSTEKEFGSCACCSGDIRSALHVVYVTRLPSNGQPATSFSFRHGRHFICSANSLPSMSTNIVTLHLLLKQAYLSSHLLLRFSLLSLLTLFDAFVVLCCHFHHQAFWCLSVERPFSSACTILRPVLPRFSLPANSFPSVLRAGPFFVLRNRRVQGPYDID
jgi:hypothetical protein